MHEADIHAHNVLRALEKHFGVGPIHPTPMRAARNVLVGFELEVPWRAYFPELWMRYFKNGEHKYRNFSADEIKELNRECSALEDLLLPRLRATVECGITRGNDRYWEFAFPPVQDLGIMSGMLTALNAAGLLPWGRYSLQATISGVKEGTELFIALLMIELLFVRKERIEQGFVGYSAWARKGDGGVHMKNGARLSYGSESGAELRTLELPDTPAECDALFKFIARLTHFLTKDNAQRRAQFQDVVRSTERILTSHGLPFGMWGTPIRQPEIWQRYLACFDDLRHEMSTIVENQMELTIGS